MFNTCVLAVWECSACENVSAILDRYGPGVGNVYPFQGLTFQQMHLPGWHDRMNGGNLCEQRLDGAWTMCPLGLPFYSLQKAADAHLPGWR